MRGRVRPGTDLALQARLLVAAEVGLITLASTCGSYLDLLDDVRVATQDRLEWLGHI